MGPLHSPRALGLVALAGLSVACQSAGDQRANADKAVYAILEQRRNELFREPGQFTIDPPEDSLRQRLLHGAEIEPMHLIDAVSIASENSRTYQDHKETLYRTALDLTLARYTFQVQQTGTLGALLAGDLSGSDPAASAFGDYTLTKILGTGAAIVGDIGFSLVRKLGSGDHWDLATTYDLSITQPLMRGFGERIVKEPLTQAERDVVYEVRSFERFRRTFAVDVASRYYRIIQQRDQVANEERNYANLQALRVRNEELAKAGRLSDIQVDQARQDELRSKNNLIEQRQRMENLLDDFKFFLGLPIESAIELAASALDDLTRENAPLLDERTAIDTALAHRLDYLTALDRVDDRDRKVYVAADALRGEVNVNGEIQGVSVADQPANFKNSAGLWTLGLDVDLPIDRLRERNAYREALINLEAEKRNAVDLADTITTGLRASLREAEATLQTLEIQRNAQRLADRRVQSARMNLEAGRADTRDILEAQDALVEAQNAVTTALIDHHLARLALWRDIEALHVDASGITLDPAFVPTEGMP